MNLYSSDKALAEALIGRFRELFHVGDAGLTAVDGQYSRSVPTQDVWQQRAFYRYLRDDSRIRPEGEWHLLVLSPNPFLYYYERFGIFPIIVGSSIRSEDEYIEAINADPSTDSADAIATRAEKTVFITSSGDVVLYFDEATDTAQRFDRVVV